ncbi:MAG: hypothetical protein DI598_13340 [Pseudopedobacter saltans]|uniref:5'-Nucleotidase C-terminal domain-containing protein n=1 Tax=Pseudopedobacter saltans TaxID=151895 RepID=A0A2W5EMP9_9SPHI|nr:MAG: hypothetical protein DI598_13340 [Pseudopedobacter saltans]
MNTRLILYLLSCGTLLISHAQSSLKPQQTIINDTNKHVIGFSTILLTNRKPEGLLGNFITDAVKNEAEIALRKRIDIVFISSNAIKGTIPKGEITEEKIKEILPFDDSLSLMEIKGKDLKQILDRIAYRGGAPVSGVRMQIQNMKASNIYIDGDTLILEKKYMLITIERNALGKENFPILKTISFKNLPNTLTTVVIKYIKKITSEGKAISSYFGHRISYD